MQQESYSWQVYEKTIMGMYWVGSLDIREDLIKDEISLGNAFKDSKVKSVFSTQVSVELEKENILWLKMQSGLRQSKRRVMKGAT